LCLAASAMMVEGEIYPRLTDRGILLRSSCWRLTVWKRPARPVGKAGRDRSTQPGASCARGRPCSSAAGRSWPDVIVADNTLQVHISALRKALGPVRVMLRAVSGCPVSQLELTLDIDAWACPVPSLRHARLQRDDRLDGVIRVVVLWRYQMIFRNLSLEPVEQHNDPCLVAACAGGLLICMSPSAALAGTVNDRQAQTATGQVNRQYQPRFSIGHVGLCGLCESIRNGTQRRPQRAQPALRLNVGKPH
jgi:hypothetical protein